MSASAYLLSPTPSRPASPARRSGPGAPPGGWRQAAVAVVHVPSPCVPLLREVSGSYTFRGTPTMSCSSPGDQAAVDHGLSTTTSAAGAVADSGSAGEQVRQSALGS